MLLSITSDRSVMPQASSKDRHNIPPHPCDTSRPEDREEASCVPDASSQLDPHHPVRDFCTFEVCFLTRGLSNPAQEICRIFWT